MSSIAVVDIGKTNVKIVQFGQDGRVLREAGMPNRSLDRAPYLHVDVAAIWRFALATLGAFQAAEPIGDIVVTTHGASGAVIGADPDADDGLVLPILDYESPLPDGYEDRYAPIRPPFAETLSPPLDRGLVLGRQFAALAWQHPEAFARAAHLVTYAQYWSWRLSGVVAGEVTSLACHGDLWRPAEGGFSSLVTAMNWGALLAPVRPAWEVLGPIRPALAAAHGLDPLTRIRNGIHDSNASLLPHLLARPAPFTVVSTGTWVVLMAVGGDAGRLDPAADMLANVDATGRAVACAKFMGGREFAHLAGPDPIPAGKADLEAVIAQGIVALPSFAETGGPFGDRAGRMSGGPPGSAAARTARATLYVAQMTDDLLTRLGNGGPVVIEGSFARNPAYAAVLQQLRPHQPVELAEILAGTARGAALLAVWPQGFAGAAAPPARRAASWVIQGLEAYRARWTALTRAPRPDAE